MVSPRRKYAAYDMVEALCSEQGWNKQGDCYVVDTYKRSRSIGAMNFM